MRSSSDRGASAARTLAGSDARSRKPSITASTSSGATVAVLVPYEVRS
ncbi:hypothetical protein QDR37_08570 [Amnibacterium sp. CER49]|nr:hypothetical protein [Amnibacterium sp. CER49]MDH2443995.1 hypothetical protein [Amnibacterium sp. CER49]